MSILKTNYSLFNGCVTSVITEKGEQKVLKSTSKVAFIYATISSYPEGLTKSQCSQLDLDTGNLGLKKAIQLGLIKQEGAKYIAQPLPADVPVIELPVESAILKADLSVLSRAAKEYYFWALNMLHCGASQKDLTKNVFLGKKGDVIGKTNGVHKGNGRTFQDVVQDSISKIEALKSKGLVSALTTSNTPITALDITEANREEKVVFKVGKVPDVTLYPEQVFSAPKSVGKPKATPETFDFSNF